MPTLYVVATPIGNLEDISLRALRILREVKLIAAEDTRRTRRLTATYDIKTPVTSYHERNKWTKLDYVLKCLEDGDVAVDEHASGGALSEEALGGDRVVSAVAERVAAQQPPARQDQAANEDRDPLRPTQETHVKVKPVVLIAR